MLFRVRILVKALVKLRVQERVKWYARVKSVNTCPVQRHKAFSRATLVFVTIVNALPVHDEVAFTKTTRNLLTISLPAQADVAVDKYCCSVILVVLPVQFQGSLTNETLCP